MGNADYLLNSKNTLAMRYLFSQDPQVTPFGIAGLPGMPTHSYYANTNSTLKLTSIVSSNWVNEAHAAMQRNIANGSDLTPQYTPQSIGQTPIIPTQTQPQVVRLNRFGQGRARFRGCCSNGSSPDRTERPCPRTRGELRRPARCRESPEVRAAEARRSVGLSSASITVQGASSPDTGHKQRDKHLRSADFFHTDEHPQAVLTVTLTRPASRTRWSVREPSTWPTTPRPVTFTTHIQEATGQVVVHTPKAEVDRGVRHDLDSALTIYQDRRRAGFCEVSTSVEQAMAALDENTVPPEGLAAQSGYQIHFNGNLSFGAITNRVRFDGRLQFSSARAWRELNLKVSTSDAVADIHSCCCANRALQIHQRGSELRARPEFCRLAESQRAVARAGRRVGRRFSWGRKPNAEQQ